MPDVLFPVTDPMGVCSRCLQPITPEDAATMRRLPKPDEPTLEWRYHRACAGAWRPS